MERKSRTGDIGLLDLFCVAPFDLDRHFHHRNKTPVHQLCGCRTPARIPSFSAQEQSDNQWRIALHDTKSDDLQIDGKGVAGE